jgi:hypothetical protein
MLGTYQTLHREEAHARHVPFLLLSQLSTKTGSSMNLFCLMMFQGTSFSEKILISLRRIETLEIYRYGWDWDDREFGCIIVYYSQRYFIRALILIMFIEKNMRIIIYFY